MPSTRSPAFFRTGILLAVMAGLLAALLWQRHAQDAEENKKLAEQAAAHARHAAKPDYDNPKGRAEVPLETPDYLGEPGFGIEGDESGAGAAAYEQARAASRAVASLKSQRAAASPRQRFSVPNSSRLPTLKDVRERYLAFRMRELKAYQELTQDEGEARQAGELFLRGYILSACQSPDAPAADELVNLAQDATAAESRDPLVRSYAAYTLYRETADALSAEEVWSEVVQELRETKYPRIVHLYTRLFAYDVAKNTRLVTKERRQALVVTIVRWLEEETRQPEWADCVHEKLEQIWSSAELDLRRELVFGCLNSGGVDRFIVHWLVGSYEQQHGWLDRGHKWAQDTTSERWAGFGNHMDIAATHLQFAWLLRPESPYPPAEMITVAQGGFDPEYTPYDWFLRTVECRFDHYPAYSRLLTSLLPRWGGSLKHFEQFSRGCLETNRFDTFVPYAFLDILNFVRKWEFKSDWSRLKTLGADALTDDFLARRERYRMAHPGVTLFGDSATYRTRLGLLLEHLGRPADAVAEFRQANGDVDALELQDRNRPGRHLLRLLHAAQGDVRERVLAFDERLRKRWPADTDAAEFGRLRRELIELRQTAGDETAGEYYRHAERMLEQLETYVRGEWVHLELSDGGLGWEIRADDVRFADGRDEVLLSREAGRTPHIWARPLAHFEPPFLVEADVSHVNFPVFIERVGVTWSRPDLWSEADWDLKQLFAGLNARWTIAQTDERGKLLQRGRQRYVESAEFSTATGQRFEPSWTGKDRPGVRRLSWKLWNNVFEAQVGGFSSVVHLPEAIAADGILSFGEPYPQRDHRRLQHHAGQSLLSGVRIRRLRISPPPVEDAPPAQRALYWSQRAAADADDAIAQLQHCQCLWRQEAVKEVLAKSEGILTRWPEMKGVQRFRGLALLQLRRYAEVLEAFRAAFDEPGDDLEAYLAAAEILAAAPQADLRNGREARGIARMVRHSTAEPGVRTFAVLAAAYAEAGEFEQAREANLQAIELAPDDLKQPLRERRELYESNTPFRLPMAEPADALHAP
ncbi:MAG: hypothetical protein KY476_02590 [Planctomycetes bacterium]|nr:hypothetical protein [Planctomycetota bacterium]